MPLEIFNNEEAQSSVRTKINTAIEAINSLTDDLSEIDNSVESLDSAVNALTQNLGDVTTSMGTLAGEVDTVKDDVTALSADLSNTKDDVSALNNEVSQLSETVDDLIENGGGPGPGGSQLVLPDIDYTGSWLRQVNMFSTPQAGLTLFPGDIQIEGEGAWIKDISIYEDSQDGGLQSLSFNNLVGTIEDISIRDMKELESLSFPELKIIGEDLYLDDLNNLTTLNFDELVAVLSDISIYRLPLLTEANFPLLEVITYMNFENLNLVTQLTFDSLKSIGYLYITNCPELTNIDFPELVNVEDGLDFNNSSLLTSLTFPKLERIHNLYLNYSLEQLTHFRYGSAMKAILNEQQFNGCSLDKASVDHILETAASLDGNNGTTLISNINIYMENNNAPATIENAATLQKLWDFGVNVYVNYAESFTFNMTAGTAGTAIGYIDGVTGSVDDTTVRTYLRDLNVDNGVLNLRFEDIGAIGQFINNRSLWIDEVQYMGGFYNDNGFIFFESDAEADIPTFVNGQTYNILIGNPT